jgi:hypothetical protein
MGCTIDRPCGSRIPALFSLLRMLRTILRYRILRSARSASASIAPCLGKASPVRASAIRRAVGNASHLYFTVYFQAVDSPIHLDGQPLGAANPSENWRERRMAVERELLVPWGAVFDCSIANRALTWQAMAHPHHPHYAHKRMLKGVSSIFDKCPAPLQSDRGTMTVFLNKPASGPDRNRAEQNRTSMHQGLRLRLHPPSSITLSHSRLSSDFLINILLLPYLQRLFPAL